MINSDAMEFIKDEALRGAEIKRTSAGQEVSAAKHIVIEAPRSGALQVSTLQAVVDYLISSPDHQDKMVLHIQSPTRVTLYGTTNVDRKRDEWLQADAITPHFTFDNWYDIEDINIKLQAGFAPTDAANELKAILGNVMEQVVRNTGDDGVSQSVVTKQSIMAGESQPVPSRVTLKPFRSFVELPDQPASDFILRLKTINGGMHAKLVEADGGAWKIEAIQNIKDWIIAQLEDHDTTAKNPILTKLTILS